MATLMPTMTWHCSHRRWQFSQARPLPLPLPRMAPVSVPLASAREGQGGFDELDAPHGIATFSIDGSTYAIAASLRDEGVRAVPAFNRGPRD